MKGQIITLHANEYFAESGGELYRLNARGRMKGRTDILVGDFVEFENGAISRVYERISQFIRPSVANVEQIVAVLSSEPKPDFLMLDKLLVSAERRACPWCSPSTKTTSARTFTKRCGANMRARGRK